MDARMVRAVECAIGFIGAGNMAEALIRGLRTAGVDGSRILATNRSRRERLDALREAWGIMTTPHKAEVSGAADVLILAMKPADLDQAMTELRPHIRQGHLVISVLAGVRCASVERYLNGTPVVRAMPNLSAAVLASTTALAYGRHAGEDARSAARALFDRVGHTVDVSEDAMDAVTAVAGSGPAYVYLFMEALIEAGVQAGLSSEVARILAVQTVFGAAKLVKETGGEPADLRRRVTSPGGTTMAALGVLEARGFKVSIGDAVRQAIRRARELSRSG
ncbi:MAG: pyrroline-5-carboxylate reductase [Armatimonadota bacterium]|nr:pyrroline-5-carboxylate reductase [Armatimonadota bacterium]